MRLTIEEVMEELRSILEEYSGMLYTKEVKYSIKSKIADFLETL